MAVALEFGDFETAADLLRAALEIDPSTTKDQIARLHRASLIPGPAEHYEKGRRGRESRYPPGTSDLVRRIAALKLNHRNLDEIAWRLWWEDADVSMVPIRRYLEKIANRLDKPITEMKSFAVAYASGTMNNDQVEQYESFFDADDVGPLFGPARKHLQNEPDTYEAFVDVFLRLLASDNSLDKSTAIHVIEKALGFDQAVATTLQGDPNWFPGLHAESLGWADQLVGDSLEGRAAALSDEELIEQRDFWRWYSSYLTTVGEAFHAVYEGPGLGFGSTGKLLKELTASPGAQATVLVAYSPFFADENFRKGVLELQVAADSWIKEGYVAFQGLEHLSKAIPPVGRLVTPDRMRTALSSPEASAKWATQVGNLRNAHDYWIDHEVAENPEIFSRDDKRRDVT
jgi:hypothetical protein